MSNLSSAYITVLSLPVAFGTLLAACSLANAPADVNAGTSGAGGDDTNVVANAASSGSSKASSSAGTGGSKGTGGKGQGGMGQGGMGSGGMASGNGGGDSGAPCTMDMQCAPGYCDNGQCAPKKDPGATCGGIDECASGFCVGGLCCDSACNGACEQCGDPNNPGKCTPDVVGGAGSPSCAPYVCNGVSGDCPSNCMVASDCAAGSTCSGGLCVACPLGGSQTFPAIGSVAMFVIPQCTKTLTIEAFGAQGGNSNGGKGARMKGDFTNLTPGEKLGIAVGLQGSVNACGGAPASGGGGGGSYVWRLANQVMPLVVAGGGGGGNMNFAGACVNGVDAVVGLNGTNGNGAGAVGGVNGNGGAGNAPSGTGSGGAGWLSKGQDSTFGTGCTGGIQPFTFLGGNGSAQFGPGGVGGFGGGGGAVCGCGGGGGYSGGGAGEGQACRAGGGGAGSFNAGLNQSNSPGAQLGNGKVVITWM